MICMSPDQNHGHAFIQPSLISSTHLLLFPAALIFQALHLRVKGGHLTGDEVKTLLDVGLGLKLILLYQHWPYQLVDCRVLGYELEFLAMTHVWCSGNSRQTLP